MQAQQCVQLTGTNPPIGLIRDSESESIRLRATARSGRTARTDGTATARLLANVREHAPQSQWPVYQTDCHPNGKLSHVCLANMLSRDDRESRDGGRFAARSAMERQSREGWRLQAQTVPAKAPAPPASQEELPLDAGERCNSARFASRSSMPDLQSAPQGRFEGLVATARGKHPVPSRTRPLSPVAPMVLRLKTWESRSPPDQ